MYVSGGGGATMTATNYEVTGSGGGAGSTAIHLAGPESSSELTATTGQQQGAFTTPSSPASSSSTSKTNGGDSTFEPTVDMMVYDFDDEETLEEEEALAARESEDPSAELSNLQKESDMPIEELLALYNCSGPRAAVAKSSVPAADGPAQRGTNLTTVAATAATAPCGSKSTRRNVSSSSSGLSKDEERTAAVSAAAVAAVSEEAYDEDDYEDEEEEEDIKETSQLRKLYPETYGANDKRLLRTISRQQSDEEDDGDYSPDEDEFKKTIMVGSEFQAVIPEGFFKYDDALPYENEDKLLWDPACIKESETVEYLKNAHQAKQPNGNGSGLFPGLDAIPVGGNLRDDEQALYLLQQCGHNTDEALRRKRINSTPSSAEQMSIWSEDECRNFESGIRVYGKDFHTIQQAKVRTRSVGELVQFYYLWKKTERHDIFANKARLDKKKYNLHPGLTDYMDRFLEEHEGSNGGGATATAAASASNSSSMTLRDRSSSPSIHSNSITSLIQADNKRSSHKQHQSSASTGGSSSDAANHHHQHHLHHHHNSSKLNQLRQKDPLEIDEPTADEQSTEHIHNNPCNTSLRTKIIAHDSSSLSKIIGVNPSSAISGDLMQRHGTQQ